MSDGRSGPHYLEEPMGTPYRRFAEVPTAFPTALVATRGSIPPA